MASIFQPVSPKRLRIGTSTTILADTEKKPRCSQAGIFFANVNFQPGHTVQPTKKSVSKMARRRSSVKGNRRSAQVRGRGRNRAIGAAGSIAAFLAFGMTPLVSAPRAQADELDWIFDLVDPLLGIDPDGGATDAFMSALDLNSWFDPSGLDSALAADPLAASPVADTSLAGLYNTWFYEPAHTFDQAWINGDTFLGSWTVQFDDNLNDFWTAIGGEGMLIGNGMDGADGGTLAAAAGGAGGLPAYGGR